MATNVPFTKLDFTDIKSALKDHLKAQTQFKDYDFEGSNMSVLLDVLSYNTFQNNIYTNMAYSEMFLDSAQLRDSVVSHAKELNYLPRSRRSSRVLLNVALTVNDGAATVTIPRGTKFKAFCGTATYYFVSDETVEIVPDTNGYYRYNGLPVYEGEIIKEYFTVTGDNADLNKFAITNTLIDTTSIRVKVFDNSESLVGNEYTLAENLFGVYASDKVFYVEPFTGEQYAITFGKDTFGKQPIVGNVIEVEYRYCNGAEPNGAKRFGPVSLISGYNASVSLNSASNIGSEGGAERESITSIQYYAPKAIQIQDRAVTASDYEILLKNSFPEIQAVSVYGGEEAYPPQYGRVIVAVDVLNADGVTQNDISRYTDFLKARSPLTSEPVIISPDFMYIYVESTITYNKRITAKTSADIKDLVTSTILGYSDTYLSGFKKPLRYSKFVSTIDAADESIISNSTKVKAVIDLNPITGTTNNISIELYNPIVSEQPLRNVVDIATFEPSVRSGQFSYQGSPAYIQDNGMGYLQIVTATDTGYSVLNSNVGQVNYDTGSIYFKSLFVTSYSGSAIKLYITVRGNDIIGPKQRITTIRSEDLNITVTGINE